VVRITSSSHHRTPHSHHQPLFSLASHHRTHRTALAALRCRAVRFEAPCPHRPTPRSVAVPPVREAPSVPSVSRAWTDHSRVKRTDARRCPELPVSCGSAVAATGDGWVSTWRGKKSAAPLAGPCARRQGLRLIRRGVLPDTPNVDTDTPQHRRRHRYRHRYRHRPHAPWEVAATSPRTLAHLRRPLASRDSHSP